jgi:hypothetical protein
MGNLSPDDPVVTCIQTLAGMKVDILRVPKRTSLTPAQLRQAAINLLAEGRTIEDTARILGVSASLLRKLSKDAVFQIELSEQRRMLKDALRNSSGD